jgi:hypothetical protein
VCKIFLAVSFFCGSEPERERERERDKKREPVIGRGELREKQKQITLFLCGSEERIWNGQQRTTTSPAEALSRQQRLVLLPVYLSAKSSADLKRSHQKWNSLQNIL